MKRALVLSAIVLTLGLPAFTQNDRLPEPSQRSDTPYRVFRTKNIYTLLKLDTRTGQVWQVQWGEANDRGTIAIEAKPIFEAGKQAGRFTLEPTENIFTFILLDQETGRTWQVQWGDDKHRFIVAIE
jgi:hypothetical protein